MLFKIIIFFRTGASPVLYAKNKSAQQWARYCGRIETAEMIEAHMNKLIKLKLMHKSAQCKFASDHMFVTDTQSSVTSASYPRTCKVAVMPTSSTGQLHLKLPPTLFLFFSTQLRFSQ